MTESIWVICPLCGGQGDRDVPDSTRDDGWTTAICDGCHGAGKLLAAPVAQGPALRKAEPDTKVTRKVGR